MSMEKEYLARECGYKNGLDDVEADRTRWFKIGNVVCKTDDLINFEVVDGCLTDGIKGPIEEVTHLYVEQDNIICPVDG